MKKKLNKSPISILLIEDNLGDIVLVEEAFKESGIDYKLSIVKNGDDAINYLKRSDGYSDVSIPDLILLDLNLPGKNGKEVLYEVKNANRIDLIPVIILTSSLSDQDVLDCYRLKANSYIAKPVDYNEFITLVKNIEQYWISTVILPPKVY